MSTKRQIFFYISALVIIIIAALIFSYAKEDSFPKNSKKETSVETSEPDACQKSEDIPAETVEAESKDEPGQVKSVREYPIHKNISVTLFWIGEDASEDNKEISNDSSAWDDLWVKHYGGTDSPQKRNGYLPVKFTPKENPFYFALPYNDLNKKGERKTNINSIIPWAKDRQLGDTASYCKNRWIKIIKDDKVVYAQWEDVGPFGEDDAGYVFGSEEPQSKTNKHAGLDVSPAVRDYLGISEKDIVDWQFVEADSVPDGPWRKIVTKTNICWE